MRDIIFLFFIVLILFAAFDPLVSRLEKLKIPRPLSAILIYIAFLFVLALILYAFIPPIAHQLQGLSEFLPQYFSQFREFLLKTQQTNLLNQGLQNSLQQLAQSLSQLSQSAWSGIISLFGGVVSFVVIVVASFYLLIYKKHFKETLLKIIPSHRKELLARIFARTTEKLGAWLIGQNNSLCHHLVPYLYCSFFSTGKICSSFGLACRNP